MSSISKTPDIIFIMSVVFQNLKMVDKSENYRIAKPNMFDLPMRLLIVGKSLIAGKTNLLGNLILRPLNDNDLTGLECYAKDFEGRNIYIISPSTGKDFKWHGIIEGKQIPEANIYRRFDEEEIAQLYERLGKNFDEAVAEGRKPEHTLLIFDDVSYTGDLKSKTHGSIALLFMNGRQSLISTIVIAQKYSDILTGARENASGCIIFKCSQKQLKLIADDHADCEFSKFAKAFRDVTKEKHSYMVINYTNPPDKLFQDRFFAPIKELC